MKHEGRHRTGARRCPRPRLAALEVREKPAARQTRLDAGGDSPMICPHPVGGARLLHNSIVTALFNRENRHVYPLPR